MSNNEEIQVGGLAAVINARLASDALLAKAKGLLWTCAGVASFLALSGLGVASSLYGYALTRSIKPAAEEVATALIEALERAELKTTVSGVMSLAPNTQLRLAPGQNVYCPKTAASGWSQIQQFVPLEI
jgi:hypothetical protein